jgi:hypothetical protein
MAIMEVHWAVATSSMSSRSMVFSLPWLRRDGCEYGCTTTGAILAELKPVVHCWQADEQQAEQGQAIPRVVSEAVSKARTLMRQVRLVEQEDGMESLLAPLLYVSGGLEEDGRSRCLQ